MNVQKKLAFALIRAKLNSLAIINRKKAGEEAFQTFLHSPIPPQKKSELFLSAKYCNLNLIIPWWKATGLTIPGKKIDPSWLYFIRLNFDKYIKPLIQKGYEILAFDAPAHGISEGKTVNAVEYSEMIIEVIRAYGPIDEFYCTFLWWAGCLPGYGKNQPWTGNKNCIDRPGNRETTTAIISAFKTPCLKIPILKKGLEDTILAKSSNKAEWFSIRRAMHNIKATVLWCHDEDDDTTPLSIKS